ncbi:MAG: hypothetical protein NC043_05945 [Muribaculaceae bacterium]|nr:hypothetical protein [Muribaculaceae bacterium]
MSGLIAHIRRALSSGNERSVKAKKNIIGSLLIKGCSILIQLILVPLTLGYMDDELYGIWLTVSSIMLWLNFFDIGFTLGLKNKLAEALAVGDLSRGKVLVSTTYGIMLLIFIPLWVIMYTLVPAINWSRFLNVTQSYNAQLTEVMRIMVSCFCLQMIFNTISSVLSAYQRTALAGAFPIIGNFLSVIVIYILTKTVPPSLVTLAESISYLPVIVLIVATGWLFSGQLKPVSPDLRLFDKTAIKSLFSLGVKFFIIQIQLVVLYQAANVLISNVSTPEWVTAYNIAYKYLGTGLMIFTLILTPLWPAFTDAYTKGEYDWMQNVYRHMTHLFMILAISEVVMALLSGVVYRFWVGSDTLVPISMTVAVTIATIIQAWVTLQTTLINGIGAIKIQTYVTLIGLFCHIPLSLYLGRFMGAIGVVTSMCIINIIYGVVFTIQIHKLLKGNPSLIWRS